jgi:hypothetical protein
MKTIPPSKPFCPFQLLATPVSIAALTVIVSCGLPYSVEDFKMIEAGRLRRNLKSWELYGKPTAYGYTNDLGKCYLVSTNFAFHGNTLDVVMALESSNFQGKGYLVATASGEVYWVGKSGLEPMR